MRETVSTTTLRRVGLRQRISRCRHECLQRFWTFSYYTSSPGSVSETLSSQLLKTYAWKFCNFVSLIC